MNENPEHVSAEGEEGPEQEVNELFIADQKDRTDGTLETDPESVVRRDKERLERAHSIYEDRDTLNLSPESLWQLAMLFQHGRESADFLKAQELAQEAADAGYEPARWLTAAAEDRFLIHTGEKQKWGTQFIKYEGVELAQSPMQADEESGVTDEMRRERGIPPRAEQLEAFLRLQKTDQDETS